MALITNNSVIYHVPKTGGLWVREALTNAGLDFKATRKRHDTYKDVSANGKYKISFVRNPLSWYPSYFGYKMIKGWSLSKFDIETRSDNFDVFMRKVFQKFPGYLTGLYKSFLGPSFDALDYIGRQETLRDDLTEALFLAGESFNKKALYDTLSVNESAGAVLTAEQADGIRSTEEDIFKSFYPNDSRSNPAGRLSAHAGRTRIS